MSAKQFMPLRDSLGRIMDEDHADECSEINATRVGQRGATAKHCALWHEFRRDGEPCALILSSADAALFQAAPDLVALAKHVADLYETTELGEQARSALKLARGEA